MGSVENRVDLSSIEQSRPPPDSMNPPPPPSNRFLQRTSAIYACIFLLSCLVLLNIAIFLLQATHFFEKHFFDIRKISTVSVIASITTQACTVIILIALSYAMQLVASDTIVRRSKCGLSMSPLRKIQSNIK
jgi:galactitol-specific phosphotransferase system IIC component